MALGVNTIYIVWGFSISIFISTLGYLYLNNINALPSLEFVGKSIDEFGETFVDAAKNKIVLPKSFNKDFTVLNRVDDGLDRLDVVHNIPGP